MVLMAPALLFSFRSFVCIAPSFLDSQEGVLSTPVYFILCLRKELPLLNHNRTRGGPSRLQRTLRPCVAPLPSPVRLVPHSDLLSALSFRTSVSSPPPHIAPAVKVMPASTFATKSSMIELSLIAAHLSQGVRPSLSLSGGHRNNREDCFSIRFFIYRYIAFPPPRLSPFFSPVMYKPRIQHHTRGFHILHFPMVPGRPLMPSSATLDNGY